VSGTAPGVIVVVPVPPSIVTVSVATVEAVVLVTLTTDGMYDSKEVWKVLECEVSADIRARLGGLGAILKQTGVVAALMEYESPSCLVSARPR